MPFDLDLEIVHPDATRGWITVRGEAMTNAAEEIIGLRGTAQDITERKRTEKALIEAEAERQQAVVESEGANEQLREQGRVLDLAQVLVRDMESRIIQWNLGAERLYGFSKEEALGRISHELCQTEFPTSRADVDEVLRRTGRWEGELVHRKRDGERLVVASQQIIYHDRSGRPVHILETNADITERLDAEQRLRKSEERLASIIGSAMDGIISVDEQQHILVFNAAAEKMFGYTASEMLGQSLDRLIPERFRAAHAGHIRKFEQTHVTRRTIGALGTIFGLRANGEEFPIEASISQAAAGEVKLFTVISRDVTERRLAEQLRLENLRLDERSRHVEEANRLKSEFLANMSHELRTPLNAIIGFTEMLIDRRPGPLNPKQQEYLGDVYNSAIYLLQLINDVLDLAKVEAGKMVFSPEQFSLGKAIDEVCTVTKAIAQKKGIGLKVNVAPALRYVTLDQQKFKQVLYNLLSNAIKFTDEGGKVEIRAAMHDAHRFKLAVVDDGIGINEEDLKRIFKEFEQVESGASRCHEGTGLGLALTRKIVELQGGTISVESEIGKGSTFTVVLPLVVAAK